MSAIGRPRRTAVRLAVGVALLLLGVGLAGLAQIGSVAVQVQPPNPTVQDVITVILSGEWKDSCVPRVTGVQVAGGSRSPRRAGRGSASWSSPRGGQPFP